MGSGGGCRQTEGYDKTTFFGDEGPDSRASELSVIDIGTDPERMRNFLAGRLLDDEDRAFSERLIRDPELVRELELTARLQEGLHVLCERGQLEGLLVPRKRHPLAWLCGLVAAGVAVVAFTVALQPASHSTPVLVAERALASGGSARDAGVVQQYSFVATRDRALPPALLLPARGTVEFRVAPPSPSPGFPYRVTLDRFDARHARSRVGTVSDLGLASSGFLYCYANAARLATGDYELRVEPEGAGVSEVGAFPFSLRPIAAP